MASKPRIAWNFRVDQDNSDLPATMVCPNGSTASSCLITPPNWGSPIAITVTPPHDDDGDRAKFLMKHQVFQKAPHNNAETASWEEDTLRIVVTDDDKYEFKGPSSVTIKEGETHTIAIRLGVDPVKALTATATITGFTDQLSASSVFSFTGNAWKDGAEYLVWPTDDEVAQARTGSITVRYTPNPGDEDPAWANTPPLTIPIKIIDDDVAGYDLEGVVGTTFTKYHPIAMAHEIYGYQVDINEGESVRYALKLLTGTGGSGDHPGDPLARREGD